MMEKALRLRVKRRGLKGSITKLMGKVEQGLSADLQIVNAESVIEAQRVTITTTIDQLKTKLKKIIVLDNVISEAIQDEGELETEICDADTYQTGLEQQLALLNVFIKKASHPSVVSSPLSHPQ